LNPRERIVIYEACIRIRVHFPTSPPSDTHIQGDVYGRHLVFYPRGVVGRQALGPACPYTDTINYQPYYPRLCPDVNISLNHAMQPYCEVHDKQVCACVRRTGGNSRCAS
jgi:hypothetical protein